MSKVDKHQISPLCTDLLDHSNDINQYATLKRDDAFNRAVGELISTTEKLAYYMT